MLGTIQGVWDNNGRLKGEAELGLSSSLLFLILPTPLELFCSFYLGILSILISTFQAFGYEFDDDEFHAYVHGRLPYESLKPDPVLRNLLLSMPQRKIVCKLYLQAFISEEK